MTTMRTRSVLWATLVIILVTSGLIWRWNDARISERYVLSRGYSQEARVNPLLAAHQLLDAFAIEVSSVPVVPDLGELGRADLLILSMPSWMIDRSLGTSLLAWVERGGHLVLPTGWQYGTTQAPQDTMLEALGFYRWPQKPTPDAVRPFEILDQRYALNPRADHGLFDVEHQSTEASALEWIGYGHGWVLLLTNSSMFTTTYLAEADHAALLIDLADDLADDAPRPERRVWLQYAPNLPSLWRILWTTAWPLFCGLAVLIVALIWHNARRFGPPIPNPIPVNRRLLDHLQASADFLLRHRRHESLVQSVRERVHQHLARRVPHWHQLDRDEQIAWLTHRLTVSGASAPIDAPSIDTALFAPQVHRERDFLDALRILQTIEKQI